MQSSHSLCVLFFAFGDRQRQNMLASVAYVFRFAASEVCSLALTLRLRRIVEQAFHALLRPKKHTGMVGDCCCYCAKCGMQRLLIVVFVSHDTHCWFHFFFYVLSWKFRLAVFMHARDKPPANRLVLFSFVIICKRHNCCCLKVTTWY